MLKALSATGATFISLVLGALLFAFFTLQFPAAMSSMLQSAAQFKAWLTAGHIPASYNVFLDLLLEPRQLVFMFLTLIARLLIAAAWSLVTRLLGGATSSR
jgi:hypothetical protein